MLVGAVVIQVLTAPGQTIGVSVFVDHFVTDLSMSRAGVSASYLIGTLVGAAAMPHVRRLIDRRGLRSATAALGVAFGVALLSMAGATGAVTLTVAFGLGAPSARAPSRSRRRRRSP